MCKKGYHPLLTCEEYAELVGDLEVEELMNSRKWKRCPYCSSIVEKMDGCNHMECYSVICQGTGNFCYLCGKGLNDYEDYDLHFGYDSDGTFCNTTRGIVDPV